MSLLFSVSFPTWPPRYGKREAKQEKKIANQFLLDRDNQIYLCDAVILNCDSKFIS